MYQSTRKEENTHIFPGEPKVSCLSFLALDQVLQDAGSKPVWMMWPMTNDVSWSPTQHPSTNWSFGSQSLLKTAKMGYKTSITWTYIYIYIYTQYICIYIHMLSIINGVYKPTKLEDAEGLVWAPFSESRWSWPRETGDGTSHNRWRHGLAFLACLESVWISPLLITSCLFS